ncbi:hypothetical protein OIU78_006048 [Salix suchowensis]|nr:hypothetical protein OIU78_006048 [Salix suchowensis]
MTGRGSRIFCELASSWVAEHLSPAMHGTDQDSPELMEGLPTLQGRGVLVILPGNSTSSGSYRLWIRFYGKPAGKRNEWRILRGYSQCDACRQADNPCAQNVTHVY